MTMKRWRCRVERHQIWNGIEVEAETEEEAKNKADAEAYSTHASDDFAYSTEADEIDND